MWTRNPDESPWLVEFDGDRLREVLVLHRGRVRAVRLEHVCWKDVHLSTLVHAPEVRRVVHLQLVPGEFGRNSQLIWESWNGDAMWTTGPHAVPPWIERVLWPALPRYRFALTPPPGVS